MIQHPHPGEPTPSHDHTGWESLMQFFGDLGPLGWVLFVIGGLWAIRRAVHPDIVAKREARKAGYLPHPWWHW